MKTPSNPKSKETSPKSGKTPKNSQTPKKTPSKEKGLQTLESFIKHSQQKREAHRNRALETTEQIDLSDKDTPDLPNKEQDDDVEIVSERKVQVEPIDLSSDSEDDVEVIANPTSRQPQPLPESIPSIPTNTLSITATIPSSNPSSSFLEKSTDVDYNLQQPLDKFDPKSIKFSTSSAPFGFLTNAFSLINQTKSRNSIIDILVNLLRTLFIQSPNDVVPVLHLASNSIAPAYRGVELGVGPNIVSKAISSSMGVTKQQLRELYKGDLGDAAASCRKKQMTLKKPQPITISHVWNTLQQIASSSGSGSQEKKEKLVTSLLGSCQGPEEVRFLVRLLIANLRIGATQTSCLISLARSFLVSTKVDFGSDSIANVSTRFKEAEAKVKEAFARLPDYSLLLQALKESGIEKLTCKTIPGVPIAPMLGKISQLDDAFEKMKATECGFIADLKWDGMRAQVHFDGTNYNIYSRHLEDGTQRWPEVLDALKQAQKEATSYILDCEVIAMDPETGQVKPFSFLANRPRKAVQLQDVKDSPVCLQVFDCMYLNGQDLTREPLRRRLELAKATFVKVPKRFEFISQKEFDGKDKATFLDWFKQAIDAGAEGLMVKLLDNPSKPFERGALVASYEPDKRGDAWLKVKKDYAEEYRSLDLIVMGAWNGQGRKAKWYSPFLLGCYNPDTGEVESVCKIMSGFSDAFYQEQLQVFSEEKRTILDSKPPYYVSGLDCQYWFPPEQVWEIRGADLSLSPVHKSAIGQVPANPDRGISLRFPRFVRVRDDKGMEEATTSLQMVEAYEAQTLFGHIIENDVEEADE